MKRALLRTVFFWVCTALLGAQSFFENNTPPRFGLIDQKIGLNSLSVSSVVQDRYGFLWLGTQGGLSRFDGRHVVTFTHDPFDSASIPNDLVQTLYYARKGAYLWVGTYGGLTRLNVETGAMTHFRKEDDSQKGLSNNIVIAICQDNDGHLWIGTMDGLNRMSLKDNEIQRIKAASPTIRSLYLDSSGIMWVGSYGGLQYWDRRKQCLITPDLALPSSNVMSIREAEPGRFILGLWDGGVVEYWPQSHRLRRYSLPDNRVYTVLETRDKTLWAGTWGGGLWARPGNGDPVWFDGSRNSELANKVIYSLYEDKGGLLWVGTNGGGLHYLSPRRHNYRIAAHNPGDPHSLAAGKIQVICKRDDGKLYIGVDGEGLNVLDPGTGKVTILKHSPQNPRSISSNQINFMLEDRKGQFWIATSHKLNLFDPLAQTFRPWPEKAGINLTLSHTIISNLMEDRQGRLWIATYGSGVDRYDPHSVTMSRFRHRADDAGSLSDNNVYYCLESRDGSIWISTNNGLNRYNPEDESFVRYHHVRGDERSLSGNTIRGLFEDSRGLLWIGTQSSGLNCYDRQRDKFFHYTTRDGLSSNNVKAIQEGKDHRIWISTRGGINVIDPRSREIEVIDERDGLFGVFFDSGSFRDEQGALYFGGSHGITRIDAIVKNVNRHIPDVHITDVSVLGRSLAGGRTICDGSSTVLPHDKNFISFEFIALDYDSPEHNQYRYRMLGLEENWIDNGSRTFAAYTNLPPGKYRFMVIASNNDGVWNRKGAYVDIRILSPLYRQWWAYLLYCLLFFGLLVMIWKYKESRLFAQKNRELERANTLLEEANTELEKLSVKDKLTGLYNRRYFDKHFEDELLRAKRAGDPLSLLMMDLDRFKSFNDTYGHVAGDMALVAMSQVLQSATQRKTDFVTRYGGEEFVIVLFRTDLQGAQNIADRIHEMLKETVVLEEYPDLRLSVSIGINSTVPRQSCVAEMFVKKADMALYQAKRNGRSRTEVYSEA